MTTPKPPKADNEHQEAYAIGAKIGQATVDAFKSHYENKFEAQLSELRAKNEALEAQAGAMREALIEARGCIIQHHESNYSIEPGEICSVCKEEVAFNAIAKALHSTAGQSILDEVKRLKIDVEIGMAEYRNASASRLESMKVLTAAKARIASLEEVIGAARVSLWRIYQITTGQYEGWDLTGEERDEINQVQKEARKAFDLLAALAKNEGEEAK